jgi:hypothetical protein
MSIAAAASSEAGALWLALAGLFLAGLAATRVLGLLAKPGFVRNLAVSLGVQALLVIYLTAGHRERAVKTRPVSIQ